MNKSKRPNSSDIRRYLTEKHVKRPVIVLSYPKDIKALYMRQVVLRAGYLQ